MTITQIQKQAVKERIYEAALDTFYEKGYKDATMREIADRAEIPVGLIYTYYKGKAELIEAIVEPVLEFVSSHMVYHENLDTNSYFAETQSMLMTLMLSRKAMIIAVDKSAGTKYENTKELVINMVTKHIANERPKITANFEEFHANILAISFVEAVMAVARNYESREWAARMLTFITDRMFPSEIPRPA
ncbi:MAG: TetR/AcrR family transcriptional regulator [Deferribacteraceae bacterium]|jgi:AcrR family transcriptional regulator|nr:TetR/AcrR family transcriptional regulator [Deferribacteraceae bacterium]